MEAVDTGIKRTIEPDGIPVLIEIYGWTIWSWTGWKGSKLKALCDSSRKCPICHVGFSEGDYITWTIRSHEFTHWLCSYPSNPPDRLVAQWLACAGDRRIGASVDALDQDAVILEYRPGDEFPIREGVVEITENTSEHDKQLTCDKALMSLITWCSSNPAK